MQAICWDSPIADDSRRGRTFVGDVFVFSPRPSTIAFTDFGRSLIEEAFAPLDPREAQLAMPVERFVEIVAPLKPRFIHDPESKRHIQRIIDDFGCDLERTYLDVPRLRVVSSDGYLTSGVGHQLDAHRDTWWAAPMCQLNWWSPIYDFQPESSMAFFPHYWSRPVRNSSRTFNYYEWNAIGRKEAAKHVATDTRNRPDLEEPVAYDPRYRLVVPVGSIILFSGAQLHSTVPNTTGLTRFIRDFMRGTDLARLPENVVKPYDREPPTDGVLVFAP